MFLTEPYGDNNLFQHRESVRSHEIICDIKTNEYTCVKVCYTHRIPPTYFGHPRGHLQRHILQRTDTSIYSRSF